MLWFCCNCWVDSSVALLFRYVTTPTIVFEEHGRLLTPSHALRRCADWPGRGGFLRRPPSFRGLGWVALPFSRNEPVRRGPAQPTISTWFNGRRLSGPTSQKRDTWVWATHWTGSRFYCLQVGVLSFAWLVLIATHPTSSAPTFHQAIYPGTKRLHKCPPPTCGPSYFVQMGAGFASVGLITLDQDSATTLSRCAGRWEPAPERVVAKTFRCVTDDDLPLASWSVGVGGFGLMSFSS